MAIISAKWSRIISNLRLYRSSQAVSVIGQNAYIFGGELVPRQPIDSKVDVVGISNGPVSVVQTIPASANAPTARVGSPSTTFNDSIWIFSGRGGLEMKPLEEKGSLWRYDTIEAQWELVQPTSIAAPHPAGRSYHSITSNGDDKLYVHSGCPEVGRLSDLWEFDIKSKTWTELPSAPGPARGGASMAYLNGNLYRINGFDGQTEQGGKLDIFEIHTSTWHSISYEPNGHAGPEARSVAALLPVTTKDGQYLITMFGERDPSSLGHAGAGKMLSDVWAWDIQHGDWQQLSTHGDTPEPRGWFDADVVKNGNGSDGIILHGGLNEANQRLGDVWKLSFE